jgi:acyl-CoA synthetase (AMP-forming)/AMP-acid ligase II
MNTADYLLGNAPDANVAIITKDSQHTFGELKTAAARLGSELLANGVQPGERVGILASNSLFWAAGYLAILKIGAVAAPFSTLITPEDVQRNAEFVGLRVALMEQRQARKYGAAFGAGVKLIFEDALSQPASASWANLPSTGGGNDDAALMFTSGTTARPRAVRVTHRNIQANTDSIIEYLDLSAAERIMVILPFYYCFGTSLLHTHLRAGGTVVLSNTFTYPETVLDLMERAECTGFAGVPSSFQILLRNSSFPRRELPSLRKIQQAGGKLHPVLIQELVAAKPNAHVYVMYGQTEATARLSYLPPRLLPTKLGSIGRGIPGVELKVLGETGSPVAPGEVGEIIAYGDNISPGYFNEPESSAEKFIDGALHTGDLATIDDEGFIFVVDRKSDFIKSFGYRVSSQEVESCVLQIPDIVSAAAVGIPDLEAGEAIYVFITLRARAEVAPEAIIAHCRERLARHMVPRQVVEVKSMPLNAHGKIVKSELKKLVPANG